MSISKSPLAFQRLKSIRGARRYPLKDKAMTAEPRYGTKTVMTHRRGEKRMGRWQKYA